jgi:hypothetical protein
MIATLAARAATLAGIDPDEISFTAVLGLVRACVHAETRCEHCGRRPGDPSAACSPASSPARATAPAANARPAALRPSGAPGTPKKPATPLRSRRRIPQWDESLAS